MKLSAPKGVTWLLAILIGGLGILMKYSFVSIPVLNPYIFWLEVAAFGLLALAALIKGL